MEFISNIARKTGKPSLLAVEAEKTRCAAEIGKESGLFYVPEIINFDSKKGILDSERLYDIVTLQELIINRDSCIFEIMEKAGRALAVIHEQLVLPDEMKIDLPKTWHDRTAENVFIHGDLTLRNLCFCKSNGALVILDWSAAPLVGRHATFGPREFDITWLVSYLFYAIPKKLFFVYKPSDTADAFLKGYAAENREVNDELLQKVKYLLPKYYWENIWFLAKHQPLSKVIIYFLWEAILYTKTLGYRSSV